jgi:proteasome lid subunit RPN8/RPN11
VADPNATHDTYTLSAAAAQAQLTSYQQLTGDKRIGYIGEWHSHPNRPHPSYVDRTALMAITRRTGQSSVAIVVGTDTSGNPDFRAMLGQVTRNPFKKVRRAHIERITQ